jgi:hypothetical protein
MCQIACIIDILAGAEGEDDLAFFSIRQFESHLNSTTGIQSGPNSARKL